VNLGLFARFIVGFDRLFSASSMESAKKRYQIGITDTTRKTQLFYAIHYTIKSE